MPPIGKASEEPIALEQVVFAESTETSNVPGSISIYAVSVAIQPLASVTVKI